MSDLYDGQQRIAVALERMQKVQEYDSLRAWLKGYDSRYPGAEYEAKLNRIANLREELWPDA